MVTIIIPVFNEEERVSSSVEEIFNFLKTKKIESEVLIINDGSRDKTLEILEDLKKTYPLQIVSHQTNLGKGAAIKTGVNEAKGAIILFTDIDLSVPIEFLEQFLKVLDKDTDIVIGTRAHPDAKIEAKQHWLRELMGGFFTILTNLILWVGVSDFTCGFKMFRSVAAKRIFNKQLIKRWAFDAESLYLAKKFGFNIKEVPVVWRHREGSKVRFPRDLIESFFSLLFIRMNDFFGKYD